MLADNAGLLPQRVREHTGNPRGGTRPDRPPVRPAAQGPLGVQDTGPVRGARRLSEGGGWPRLTRPGVLHNTQLPWMRRGDRCRVARPGIAHRDVRATESGRTLPQPGCPSCFYTCHTSCPLHFPTKFTPGPWEHPVCPPLSHRPKGYIYF